MRLTEKITLTCGCPLETTVTTAVPAKCYCPLETIVTKYESSNCTATPTSVSRTWNHTVTPTGSTGATPTCTLTDFPKRFFIRDSESGWLSTDSHFNRIYGVLSKNHAAVFHIASVNDGSISEIPQLAFNTSRPNSNSTEEHRAFIRYTGGPVRFFNSSFVPEAGNNYEIITASFNSHLCQMSLITWMEHDLSYPENCGGALWLDGGKPNDGCMRVRLTVSPA